MGIDSLLRIDSLERIDSFVGIDSQLRIDSGAVIPFQISISLSRNRFPIFWESTQPYVGLGRFRLPGIENRFFFAIFGHMTGNRFLSQEES